MQNLSFKAKILLLSAFMSVVAVSIGVASYYYSQQTIVAFEQVVKDDVPSVRAVNRMLLSYRLARIELLQLIAPETTVEHDKKSLVTISEQWAAFEADEKKFESFDSNPAEKDLFAEFKKANAIVAEDFNRAIEIFKKNPAENSPERAQMNKIVLFELPAHGDALRIATSKLVEYQSKAIDEDTQRANKAAAHGNMVSMVITILGSVIGSLLAFLFANKLARQIGLIINSISESTSQVAAASSQIATASQELSQATTEQAASLEQTAASLEEISSMISKAADSAKSSETSSKNSQVKVESGQKAVEQMMTQMQEISGSNNDIMNEVSRSNDQMGEIIRVIQEIGTKTKVINDIVFQTKLLSFNASVEAARAGENGKGFAVVAEEVGKLAEMSGNAAKDISSMLESSVAKVESIVTETTRKIAPLVEQGKQKVETGVDLAQECSNLLNAIVTDVAQVTSLSQEITQASLEQSQGVTEINKAMSQLDVATQQNSATSEESASAAEELSAQAETLKEVVDNLYSTFYGTRPAQSFTPLTRANSSRPPAVSQTTTARAPASAASKSKPKSNVVSFQKPVSKTSVKAQSKEFKMAAGDVPASDHQGFRDI